MKVAAEDIEEDKHWRAVERKRGKESWKKKRGWTKEETRKKWKKKYVYIYKKKFL